MSSAVRPPTAASTEFFRENCSLAPLEPDKDVGNLDFRQIRVSLDAVDS